jgi:cytochrome c553
MPSTDYKGLSDEDVSKLVAFIRNSNPQNSNLPAIKIGLLARFLYFFGKMPNLISAEQIEQNITHPEKVTKEISIEYGKYVAATCTGCHKNNMTGGPIEGAPPSWPEAPNITKNGLSNYNEKTFIEAIRTGKKTDGSEIRFPMPWQSLSKLTDVELKSVWLYLQSLN